MFGFGSKDRRTATVTLPSGLEDRLAALERELKEQRADAALLRREWADTLDKLQTWFGREAARKRQQLHRSLERQQGAELEEAAPAVGPGTGMSKAELRRIAAAKRFNGGIG